MSFPILILCTFLGSLLVPLLERRSVQLESEGEPIYLEVFVPGEGQCPETGWLTIVPGLSGVRFRDPLSGRAYTGFKELARDVSEGTGCITIILEPRGQGQSGGRRSHASIQHDLHVTQRWASDELHLPKDELCIFGHCGGGAAALGYTLQNCVGAVVTWATPPDISSYYAEPLLRARLLQGKRQENRLQTHHESEIVNPWDIAHRIRTPWLILGNRKDPYFDVERQGQLSKRAYDAQVELAVTDGDDHYFRARDKSYDVVLNRTLDWLRQHCQNQQGV